jgi:hypothetical protein
MAMFLKTLLKRENGTDRNEIKELNGYQKSKVILEIESRHWGKLGPSPEMKSSVKGHSLWAS